MGGGGGVAYTRWRRRRDAWFAKREAGGGSGQKPPNELPWLGLGLGLGSQRSWGVVWAYRPPCRGNLGGRELAVSLYSVGGLVLLTLDLHPLGPLHLLSTPFFLSPSTPIPIPGAHGWVRYSPMGLMFGADLVRTTQRQSPYHVGRSLKLRSIPIQFRFRHNTGLLKS